MAIEKTVTFIGGPWDLHRVGLADVPPMYRVPMIAKPKMVMVAENNPIDGDAFAKIETAHYRRADLKTWEGVVTVYAYEGVW